MLSTYIHRSINVTYIVINNIAIINIIWLLLRNSPSVKLQKVLLGIDFIFILIKVNS